jgi:hypothetical protein
MQGKVFEVPLQGRIVECVSADDALDIKAADLTLANPDDVRPGELERLAGVLLRYGRDHAAEKLNERARRLRAVQFLMDAFDKGARTAR